MKCIHCNNDIVIKEALESSSFSWPLMQTIWCECLACHKGNHIRFEKGKIILIKTLGSPGSEWEALDEINEPSVEIKIDPEYFHIWFQGNHFEIKERA